MIALASLIPHPPKESGSVAASKINGTSAMKKIKFVFTPMAELSNAYVNMKDRFTIFDNKKAWLVVLRVKCFVINIIDFFALPSLR